VSAVPAPETGPDAGAIWHYGDPLGEQRAAETGAVLVDRSHRGVLTLTGDDRQTWLHSISTQFISELPDGASTQNLSLDGQGRVEDHWIQTELGGVTYLDTEPWRAEPLLAYLQKMVFWSQVTPATADLSVLSLLGPALGDPAVLDALRVPAAQRTQQQSHLVATHFQDTSAVLQPVTDWGAEPSGVGWDAEPGQRVRTALRPS